MTREDQIAAEIAARYGVPVMAGAVQVLPPCTFSWQVEEAAKAAGVVAPEKGQRSGALRRMVDAQYKNLARAARLRKADAAQVKGPTAGQVARAEASALREAQLRAMVAEGLPRQVIADRLGLKVATLQAYARGLQIGLPVKPFDRRARSGPKRGLVGGEAGADCLGPSVAAKQESPVTAFALQHANVIRGASGCRSRDDLIREQALAGVPVLHIARALGVPTPGVYRAVRRMGLPVVMVVEPSKRAQARDARRAYGWSLLDGGMDATAVARLLMAECGIKQKTARRDMKSLGLTVHLEAEQGPKRKCEARSAALGARRAVVRDLAFGGLSRKEIMEKVGCGATILARDLRALAADGLPDGVAGLPAFAGSVDVAAREAQRVQVVAMRKTGAKLRDIATALGLSLSTVCVACRKAGLADHARYAPGRRGLSEAEALEKVGAMLAAGLAVSTIRRKLGLGAGRLKRLQGALAERALPERLAA